MATPVTLEGRGVRLEPLSLDHASDLAAAGAEDHSTYDFIVVPVDEASARRYIEEALTMQRKGWELAFATRDLSVDRIVGSTRFLDLERWDRTPESPTVWTRAPVGDEVPTVCEIGATWLAGSAQRTGINTEAKLLMLRHAFEEWGVHRVSFKTDARNLRSRASIERLGAKLEGVRRAHVPAVDGSARDTAYYSIVTEEWEGVRARLEGLLAGSVR
jgi:N-acetyltransferase